MTRELGQEEFLRCDLAHIPPHFIRYLEETPPEQWEISGGPMPYGYMFYAHDEDGSAAEIIPKGLMTLFAWAQKVGCAYVYFDEEGEPIEGLGTYDESVDLWAEFRAKKTAVTALTDDDRERLIYAAQRHGEASEPYMEVGDLQDLLRLAWNTMSNQQHLAFINAARAHGLDVWARERKSKE